MRTAFSYILLLFLVVSCGKKGSDPKPVDIGKLLQNGAWNVHSVVADNVDLTEDFEGMTLTFASQTYSTTAGGLLWPASGTWAFTSNKDDEILRDNEIVISIDQASAKKLVLKFNWDGTLGSGRIRSVSGEYTFEFMR